MKYLLLILSLISNFTWALDIKDIKKDEFLATDYFSAFAYQDHSKAKQIFAFESKLIDQALWVEKYLTHNPHYRAPRQKYSSHVELAMKLVYASMLIMNNNNGVIEEKFNLDDLIQFKNGSSRF